MDSTIVDKLLDSRLDGNTWRNEGCPRRMDGEGAGLDDVAQYDVVHMASNGEEVGMGRGEAYPPVLYFLVAPLLAMTLLEVVIDLGCRAEFVGIFA